MNLLLKKWCIACSKIAVIALHVGDYALRLERHIRDHVITDCWLKNVFILRNGNHTKLSLFEKDIPVHERIENRWFR